MHCAVRNGFGNRTCYHYGHIRSDVKGDVGKKVNYVPHPLDKFLLFYGRPPRSSKLLLEKGINGVPVVDAGELVGVLCQSDLVAQQKKLPIPSIFTLLDGFIPLKSRKYFEKALHKIAW